MSHKFGENAAALEMSADIIQSTGNNKVEVEKLELDSLESVREFVQRFLDSNRTLNILINNAGVMACPKSFTKDGFETQFRSHHRIDTGS